MHSPAAHLILAAVLLLLPNATPAAAQSIARPQPSPLWAPASNREVEASDGLARSAAMTRTEGLGIGFVIGGLVAGFLGYRACQAYSALGNCTGTALWWGAIGGMLGGLIGASSAGDSRASTEGTP